MCVLPAAAHVGMLDAAIKAVARSSFRFSVDPATSPANKTVGKQHPEPGMAASRGTEVVATFQ
jgi:hypothetical protein